MPAIHRDFNHPCLPEFIYWDTSYISGLYLAFLPNYKRYNSLCQSFANRVFSLDVIPVTSDWGLNEAVHLIIQNRLYKETDNYNLKHNASLSVSQFKLRNPQVIREFLDDINSMRGMIEAVCEILPTDSTVASLAFNIINNYYLRPTDAYHIAVAQSYGIASFAAIDRDFLRVDGIEVFTCLSP